MLAVEFNPLSAHERETLGLSQQIVDFGGAERLALERDFHAEVEQRVLSQPRRRFGSHGARYLRPRRTIAPPRRRHAHHHARRLELRDVPQKLQDLTRVDHGFQPRARLRGPLHRHEQGQETFLVRRARILAQRLAQRQMLRFGLRR